MTLEKAIEKLKRDRELYLFSPLTGDNKPMNEDCEESAEALTIAIKAVEKRIPQSPDNTWANYYICPNCNKLLGSYRTEYSFCPHCGQAIDKNTGR